MCSSDLIQPPPFNPFPQPPAMSLFLRILGVTALIVGSLAGFYWLSVSAGPSHDFLGWRAQEDPEPTLTPEARTQLETEVAALEEQFREVLRLRAPTDEDLALIQQAISRQQELVDALNRRSGSAFRQLDELKRLYDEQAALALRKESEQHEQMARQAESDDDPALAIAELTSAVELQSQINQRFSGTPSASLQRLSRLERELGRAEAAPLLRLSRAAEKAAREALQAEAWDTAAEHFAEAIRTQEQLNDAGRLAAFTNVTRLAELERELASLDSRDLAERIAEIEREARRLSEDEQFRDAAERLQLAKRLQSNLDETYPNSRFAGGRRLAGIDQRLQDALGATLAGDIVEETRRIESFLRRGNIREALSDIQPLVRKIQVFREDFPSSTRISRDLQAKVEYLNFIRAEVGFLQDRIEQAMVPVPGAERAARMLRTEVNQALYASIMFTNPSQNKGERLPVESVTFEDARQFCQRVSWIFGRPVRLPTREEYQAAVGSLRYVDLSAHTWNRDNSGGSPQPVGTLEANANGFHDLLGNVREWCSPSGFMPEGEAIVAGGAVLDTLESLAQVPFEGVSQRTRNRLTGFRFVIEATPLPPHQAVADHPENSPPS